MTKNITFDRNVGRKTSKYTFESNVLKYFSYFKCFIGLGLDPIRELTSSTEQRQLAYVSWQLMPKIGHRKRRWIQMIITALETPEWKYVFKV